MYFVILFPIVAFWIWVLGKAEAVIPNAYNSCKKRCRGSGGKDSSGSKKKKGRASVQKQKKQEDGAFKEVEELDIKETKIPSADTVFQGVKEVSDTIVALNQKLVDMANALRQDYMPKEEEAEFVWKEWIAQKVSSLLSQKTDIGVEVLKVLVPKVNLSSLASGELSIKMPSGDSVQSLGDLMMQLVKAFTVFADNVVEIVSSNLPDIVNALTNAISNVTSLDPSGMQEEITEAIGSNPFAVMKTLSVMKGNISGAMGLKTIMEVLLHNIKTLVLGLKDGIYKGIQDAKNPPPKQIQDAPKQIQDEPATTV